MAPPKTFLYPAMYLKVDLDMTANPDLHTHVMTASDKFLVLTTDGLLDSLSTRDIGKAIRSYKENEDENAAQCNCMII